MSSIWSSGTWCIGVPGRPICRDLSQHDEAAGTKSPRCPVKEQQLKRKINSAPRRVHVRRFEACSMSPNGRGRQLSLTTIKSGTYRVGSTCGCGPATRTRHAPRKHQCGTGPSPVDGGSVHVVIPGGLSQDSNFYAWLTDPSSQGQAMSGAPAVQPPSHPASTRLEVFPVRSTPLTAGRVR